MTCCPLCGSTVAYMGLNTVECNGPTSCENSTKEVRAAHWTGRLRSALLESQKQMMKSPPTLTWIGGLPFPSYGVKPSP